MAEPSRGPRWRTVVILAVASVVVLSASVAVSLNVTGADSSPLGGTTYPPLVLKGELVKRIPWSELPANVAWDGRQDSDNRNKELQAMFEGQTIYKLVGLVDDEDPKTFNVAKAKRGYAIWFIASDGYKYQMDSREIIGKTKWIVARLKDGEPLPANEGPYRDVGSFVGFLAGPSVKMLVRIELEL
jgi:hypothetical protein